MVGSGSPGLVAGLGSENVAVSFQPHTAPELTALLGPTNTGKTHRAVERLLEHRTGMIGLPLRLLAREVYDKLSVRAGEQAVALITGEEKRVPAQPRYWVCTVEAMPLDRKVDFLAVDEIQLATHIERGHVFTDRLLHARGRQETWFLGSNTLRPMIAALVPKARIRSHTRLSTLTHGGRLKVSGLPPRSAIVAFSMARVWELADRVRARRGGAAVVLGALSPRTRNAQVALYQSGEVDYLVATDAIGMGLNLDVDHVAFAELTKFDGRASRPLDRVEVGQIAGRAGRHLNDGTFGTLAPADPFSHSMAAAVEQHRFPVARRVMWRNRDLDYTGLDPLLASLDQRPSRPELRLTARAADSDALRSLARDPNISSRVGDEPTVRLLWDVCQIPDYRQLVLEDHVALLGTVFRQLASARGTVSADWMDERIKGLDLTTGAIDDLLTRLAFIRTWTYIAHRPDWTPDPEHWRARTRAIEDRVSDALHEQLVARFVDRRRTSVVAPARQNDGPPLGGSPFAVLAELATSAQPAAPSTSWLEDLIDAPHERITFDPSARVSFDGRQVARLVRGADLLRPDVALLDSIDQSRGLRSRLQRRLVAAARDLAGEILAPLRSDDLGEVSGAVRGLVYQLEQGLGTISARAAREQLRALTKDERRQLEQCGVRVGHHMVFLLPALKPAMVKRRVALATAFWGTESIAPASSAVSIPVAEAAPAELCEAVGFPRAGGLAVRADVLERVARMLHGASRRGPFTPDDRVRQRLCCSTTDLAPVVEALGYRAVGDGRFVAPRRRRPTSAA